MNECFPCPKCAAQLTRFVCPSCGQPTTACEGPGASVACAACRQTVEVPQPEALVRPGRNGQAPPGAFAGGGAPAASVPEPAPPEPDAVTLPCPACANPLRLVRALQHRKIVCRDCSSILLVQRDPWLLTAGGKFKNHMSRRQPRPTEEWVEFESFALRWGWYPQRELQAAQKRIHPLFYAAGIAILVGLVAVGVVAWRQYQADLVRYPYRFLPADARRLGIVDLVQMRQSPGFAQLDPKLYFPYQLSNLTGYLNAVGLNFDDAERVQVCEQGDNMGRTMLFHMTHPVDVKLLDRAQLQNWGRPSDAREWIGGVQFWELGRFGVAMLGSRDIAFGESAALRDIADKRTALPPALQPLWQPPPRTVAVYTAMAGSAVSSPIGTLIKQSDQSLMAKIAGVQCSTSYQNEVILDRRICMLDAAAAEAVGATLGKTLEAVRQQHKADADALDFLGRIQLQVRDSMVVTQLAFPPQKLDEGLLPTLELCFR